MATFVLPDRALDTTDAAASSERFGAQRTALPPPEEATSFTWNNNLTLRTFSLSSDAFVSCY